MNSTQTDTLAASSTFRIRWVTGVLIALIGGGAAVAIWNAAGNLAGAAIPVAMGVGALTTFLLFLWGVWFGGLPWQARIAIAMVSVGVLVAMVFSLRFEGMRGGMIPIFSFVWTPTKEDQLEKYLDEVQQQAQANALGREAVRAAAQPRPTDYPGYLGADRRAIVPEVELARWWEADAQPINGIQQPKPLWRHPVGLGWGAFAVVGDLAVTQEYRDDVSMVVCYHVETGVPIWEHADKSGFVDQTKMGGNGPRATPTIHDGKVYAYAATGMLTCLDLITGKQLWQRNTLEITEADNITWGASNSPLVIDNKVIVSPGGQAGDSNQQGEGTLIALDRDNGDILWKGNSGGKAAYGSALATTLAERQQVMILNGPGLVSFDAETGQRLFDYPWMTQGQEMINTTQPLVFADNGFGAEDLRIFISSGYGHGCALLEVEPSDGDEWSIEKLWENRNLQSKFATMVIRDKVVYGLNEFILTCLDLETGKRLWRKRGDFGYGQLLWVGDLLLIQSEDGPVLIWEVSPEGGRQVATIAALEHKTWNNPTLSGDRLLVRNDTQAACYRLPVRKLPAAGPLEPPAEKAAGERSDEDETEG